MRNSLTMPQLKVTSEQAGERLDVILSRIYPQYSRSFLQKVMRQGGVTIRGVASTPKHRVRAGELFDVVNFENGAASFPPTAEAKTKEAKDFIALRERGHQGLGAVTPAIIYEDESLLVIDKPANLVVHPAPGHRGATLIDWVGRHLGDRVTRVFTDPARLGLVHRLDKDTSGVLLIAKSVLAQTAVSRQFHDRSVRKTYVAFVEGLPTSEHGVITAPVGRSRKNPARMAISHQGRPSETLFEVKERFREVAQVTLFPKTGRTHQIRVHLAAIGHPIIGDHTYGSTSGLKDRYAIERTMLHAERLEFRHPESNKMVEFQAPWPADFKRALKRFRAAMPLLLVLGTLSTVRAQEDSGSPATPTAASTGAPGKKTAHHAAASAVTSSASAVRSLKKELAATNADLETVKQKVDSIQASLDQLDASHRFAELGKALSDINVKAVSGGASADETKTQILEVQRKLKAQADLVDQLRDQLDRLQRQIIQKRAQSDNVSGTPAAASPSTDAGRQP